MLDAVIFDFGLTLAYPPTFEAVVQRAGQALGRSADEVAQFVEAVYSVEQHADVLAAEVRRDYSEAEHLAADMAYADACDGDRQLMEAFHDLVVGPDCYTLYPDGEPALAALGRLGVRMGIVSNCGWDLRRNLEHLGIAQYFDAVVLSCEVGAVKPDPVLFTAALEALGADPDRTLMVGDSATADAGAAAVGIPTLLLPPVAAGADRGLDAVVRVASS